jgi:hypothetical protein
MQTEQCNHIANAAMYPGIGLVKVQYEYIPHLHQERVE